MFGTVSSDDRRLLVNSSFPKVAFCLSHLIILMAGQDFAEERWFKQARDMGNSAEASVGQMFAKPSLLVVFNKCIHTSAAITVAELVARSPENMAALAVMYERIDVLAVPADGISADVFRERVGHLRERVRDVMERERTQKAVNAPGAVVDLRTSLPCKVWLQLAFKVVRRVVEGRPISMFALLRDLVAPVALESTARSVFEITRALSACDANNTAATVTATSGRAAGKAPAAEAGLAEQPPALVPSFRRYIDIALMAAAIRVFYESQASSGAAAVTNVKSLLSHVEVPANRAVALARFIKCVAQVWGQLASLEPCLSVSLAGLPCLQPRGCHSPDEHRNGRARWVGAHVGGVADAPSPDYLDGILFEAAALHTHQLAMQFLLFAERGRFALTVTERAALLGHSFIPVASAVEPPETCLACGAISVDSRDATFLSMFLFWMPKGSAHLFCSTCATKLSQRMRCAPQAKPLRVFALGGGDAERDFTSTIVRQCGAASAGSNSSFLFPIAARERTGAFVQWTAISSPDAVSLYAASAIVIWGDAPMAFATVSGLDPRAYPQTPVLLILPPSSSLPVGSQQAQRAQWIEALQPQMAGFIVWPSLTVGIPDEAFSVESLVVALLAQRTGLENGSAASGSAGRSMTSAANGWRLSFRVHSSDCGLVTVREQLASAPASAAHAIRNAVISLVPDIDAATAASFYHEVDVDAAGYVGIGVGGIRQTLARVGRMPALSAAVDRVAILGHDSPGELDRLCAAVRAGARVAFICNVFTLGVALDGEPRGGHGHGTANEEQATHWVAVTVDPSRSFGGHVLQLRDSSPSTTMQRRANLLDVLSVVTAVFDFAWAIPDL
eukprot:c5240_g1_i1.p1 GENE.c5240_g1_i1~~c5240_g1_i1.p1  ORF type:complete len:914 (+),score=130.29 c5240_g1_i1:202-2742(+)